MEDVVVIPAESTATEDKSDAKKTPKPEVLDELTKYAKKAKYHFAMDDSALKAVSKNMFKMKKPRKPQNLYANIKFTKKQDRLFSTKLLSATSAWNAAKLKIQGLSTKKTANTLPTTGHTEFHKPKPNPKPTSALTGKSKYTGLPGSLNNGTELPIGKSELPIAAKNQDNVLPDKKTANSLGSLAKLAKFPFTQRPDDDDKDDDDYDFTDIALSETAIRKLHKISAPTYHHTVHLEYKASKEPGNLSTVDGKLYFKPEKTSQWRPYDADSAFANFGSEYSTKEEFLKSIADIDSDRVRVNKEREDEDRKKLMEGSKASQEELNRLGKVILSPDVLDFDDVKKADETFLRLLHIQDDFYGYATANRIKSMTGKYLKKLKEYLNTPLDTSEEALEAAEIVEAKMEYLAEDARNTDYVHKAQRLLDTARNRVTMIQKKISQNKLNASAPSSRSVSSLLPLSPRLPEYPSFNTTPRKPPSAKSDAEDEEDEEDDEDAPQEKDYKTPVKDSSASAEEYMTPEKFLSLGNPRPQGVRRIAINRPDGTIARLHQKMTKEEIDEELKGIPNYVPGKSLHTGHKALIYDGKFYETKKDLAKFLGLKTLETLKGLPNMTVYRGKVLIKVVYVGGPNTPHGTPATKKKK